MRTKKLVIGILAHVDAGKTTLAESILYQSGQIRELGRVDHKNTFLDTFELEKSRGITIFSKQAVLSLDDISVTLLDTPGHVDFSAEMERTLQVLDYAILVISSTDGVQGHVATLWSLLKSYAIPVFIFINKMDQDGADRVKIMDELHDKLSDCCVEFDQAVGDTFYDSVAMCDDVIMESYLAKGVIETDDIISLISQRKVFPCYFGSALKIEGVSEFLDGMKQYITGPKYSDEFGAKVYKISRDAQGNRLTHLKITGGILKVKMPLQGIDKDGEMWEEKIDQIRIYSGPQYKTAGIAKAGTICAVTGLSKAYAGVGLGCEPASDKPILEPVLTYSLQLPSGCDVHGMYVKLCQLEEEEPQLHIVWNEQANEIQVQVMGEVQIEILKSLVLERFNVDIGFSAGRIVYKETISEAVVGIGHFEPLRHYAEVHVLLEPTESGSGITYASSCSEDILDKNWQNLILTHLQEKGHRGTLTGSEITDIKITLVAGRAHQKHTEGGDFRQATYRAVRQGLKKAKSVLLEPVYEFRLEIPSDKVGRALSDIQKMSGTFLPPDIVGHQTIITGLAPVSTMRDYQTEVISYTRGEGRLFCTLKGYESCHNADEVIESIGYDSEQDIDNPTGSVFCAHGAGFTVKWDHVEEYKHVDSGIGADGSKIDNNSAKAVAELVSNRDPNAYDDKELEDIFERTYGAVDKRRFYETNSGSKAKPEKEYVFPDNSMEEYLLVDGYNIIFAWDELNELAKTSMSAARDELCEILCNFQGYKKNTVIVVFDAYRVEGDRSEVETYHNIFIVYTKKAETADQYIEKTVREIGQKYHVTVATSDALEQTIIWGYGAMRLSADGLKREIAATNEIFRKGYLEKHNRITNDALRGEMKKYLDNNN